MTEFPDRRITPGRSVHSSPVDGLHNDDRGEPREQFRPRSPRQAAASNTGDLVEYLVRSHKSWLRSNVRRSAAIYGIDSDDLIQEVMLSLLRRNTTVDVDNPGVRSWLARRVDWTAKDIARRGRREPCDPISQDDFSAVAERSVDWVSSASIDTVAPIVDPTESSINIHDLAALGLTLAEATAALLVGLGADITDESMVQPPGQRSNMSRADKSRALAKLTTDALDKLRAVLGLSDEETTVFIAWRQHGSAKAASAHLRLTGAEVEKIIAGVHKKINYVFNAGAFPIGPFGAGPWLVAYGRGSCSEDVAFQVREQCLVRGIDCVLRPIGEIAQSRIDRFVGLIVVLPSQLDTASPSALHPFACLIVDYRAHRPDGLDSILSGSCKWFDAGVVQVVGRRAIIRHLDLVMRTALDRVCVRHYTDSSRLLDVFQPYTRRCVLTQQLAQEPAGGEVRDESIERLWREVQAWGVTDLQDVPVLLKCIDDFRDHYESNRFPQLYRPVPGVERNRLDIILDGPHDVVIGDRNRKTWMENGARVCRSVLAELKKVVPGLARPSGRDTTKDTQKQLGRLYRNLRSIDNYLRDLDRGSGSDRRKNNGYDRSPW